MQEVRYLNDVNAMKQTDRLLSKYGFDNIAGDETPVIDSGKTKKNASYFLDSVIYAKQPITVYSLPSETSPVITKYDATKNAVGKIYSYVVRDGQVWWQTNWFSGKHQGWIKHVPGMFDLEVAEQTSSTKKFDDAIKKAKEDEKDPLLSGISDAASGIGSSLSMLSNLLPIIIVIVILIVLSKYVK